MEPFAWPRDDVGTRPVNPSDDLALQRAVPVPPPAPDVSILVVAYNSQAIISCCLDSIPAACTAFSYEVLLIDNGDGASAERASSQFPEVIIVPSKGNVGFAAGNNILAAHAGGRCLLLLNPDVILSPGAIDRLLGATAVFSEASAWGGVTLGRDGQPDVGNTVNVPSLREMASRTLGKSNASRRATSNVNQDAEVSALSGSFVMFSRAAWDEVGGLDERYFLYCEEVDLFFRLAKRGHRFWRIAGATATHDIGHGQSASPMRELYLSAGVMQFARLHWSRIDQLAAFVLIWLAAMQRFLAGKTLGSRSVHLKTIGEKQRYVALRPNDWRHGYDPERGLLARLRASKFATRP